MSMHDFVAAMREREDVIAKTVLCLGPSAHDFELLTRPFAEAAAAAQQLRAELSAATTPLGKLHAEWERVRNLVCGIGREMQQFDALRTSIEIGPTMADIVRMNAATFDVPSMLRTNALAFH